MSTEPRLMRILSVFGLSLMMMVVFAATIQAQSGGPASDPVDAPRSHVGEGVMTLDNPLDMSGASCPITTVISNTFTGVITQSGRIFRDGIPSACPFKTYPGIFNVGTIFNYEAHTFANPGSNDSCVVVNFDPDSGITPCGTNAHASAYLNSYDPTNQANNYVGDVGSSVAQPFSFTVPAGGVFIVQVSNTSSQATCDYSFSIEQVACQTQTDLAIDKSGPSLLSIGETTLYTITAAHTGMGALDATNVVISDVLPLGLDYVSAVASSGSYSSTTGLWSIPAVPYGSTEVLTIEVQTSAVGIVTNTATLASANEPDVDSTNDSDSVTTTIETASYTLTLTTNGTGSGTATNNPSGTVFEYGTVVTLTATADTGSTFVGWSGAVSSTQSVVTVIMDTNKSVTATFDLNQYALTITKDGTGTGHVGSNPAGIDCGVNCSSNFAYNTVVTLTATADPGSVFVGWSGGVTSTDPVIQVTMEVALTLTATFDTDVYYIYLPVAIRE
jgi:uncharacterized repeat protein (TIGR01451 family)